MATRTFIIKISEEETIIREVEIPQEDDVISKAMELGYGAGDKIDSMDAFIECSNWFFSKLEGK